MRINPRSMTFEQRETERRALLHGYTPTDIQRGEGESYTIYFYADEAGKPCLLAYRGKALRPALYFRYGHGDGEAMRAERAQRFIASIEASVKAAAARRAERNAPHDLKVGDVLRSSWGYDQTNIDYYEVVQVNGKTTVTIREIAAQSEEGGFMQGECAPLPGHFVGAPRRHRVNARYNSVRISSCQTAHKIEPLTRAGGRPVYGTDHWTAYA